MKNISISLTREEANYLVSMAAVRVKQISEKINGLRQEQDALSALIGHIDARVELAERGKNV